MSWSACRYSFSRTSRPPLGVGELGGSGSAWMSCWPGRVGRPAPVDAHDQAAFAEDLRRVPHGGVGDAELSGEVEFSGQLEGIPAGCDARGDGICYLLVDVLDAGAVYRRVVAHLVSSAARLA